MKIRFYIEQKHIDNGKPGDPWGCPLALSGQEILPLVGIGLDTMFFSREESLIVKLPPEATRFRLRFDRGLLVEPFNFVVEI